MVTKKASKPDWLKGITDTSKKIEVEPFSEQTTDYNPSFIPFNGYLCIADRPNGGKKINYALRIEDDLNKQLEDCQGSKNAVINLLLTYALADLKAKGKTLTND